MEAGRGGDSPEERRPGVRVLTLNTLWEPYRLEERTAELVQGILELDPDVVCLQELSTGLARESITQRLEARYHVHLSHQTLAPYPLLAYLPACLAVLATLGSAGLLGYSWTAVSVLSIASCVLLSPHSIWMMIVRSMGVGKAGIDPGGLAILIRRSHAGGSGWADAQLVDDCAFPHHIRGWRRHQNLFNMFLHYCFVRKGFMTVRCCGSAPELLITTTHLIDGPHNPARLQQMQMLKASVLRHARRPGQPAATVIVCGDLNSESDSPEVQLMLQDRTFLDAGQCAEQVQPHRGFITWDQRLNPLARRSPTERDCRMDYCMVSQGVVKRCERVFDGGTRTGRIVSDHFGVLTSLEFN